MPGSRSAFTIQPVIFHGVISMGLRFSRDGSEWRRAYDPEGCSHRTSQQGAEGATLVGVARWE